jgi:hypothetical protein
MSAFFNYFFIKNICQSRRILKQVLTFLRLFCVASTVSLVPRRYVLFYGLRGLCVAFAWAAWINLIDFVVRRLAESVSISGADCDFWSGLNKLDF